MPFVDSNGVRLEYEVAGSGDPILFISGTSLDKNAWGFNLPAFGNYQCVTFDNRDVGNSTIVKDSYGPVDMAKDTLGLVEQLDLAPAHVVGHSLGGVIAQELCLLAPGRVRSLVLVNTWARNDNYTTGLFEVWKTLADRLPDQTDFMSTLLFFGLGNTIIETLGMKALVEPFASVPNPQPRDAFKRQVDADLAVDTLGRLGQIDKPTLVVWGDQDDIFPERHPRQLLEGIRGAKDGFIANVGHSPAVENTEAFNKLVGEFIAGL